MNQITQDHDERASRRDALRRLLAAGIATGVGAALIGCASGGSSRTPRSGLPEPAWPETSGLRGRPSPPRPTFTSAPTHRPARADAALPSGVIPRSSWAAGSPVPRLMDPMLPVTRITLHHDGDSVFESTYRADAGDRLERIRRYHRSLNWGDIGYHYLIDPAGRVWQGRPLSWQGAHVADQNPGNLGICVMGNFDRQQPTGTQIRAVERFVAECMTRYRVPLHEVRTHREMASTLCPGRYLQPRIDRLRRSGTLVAMG